MLLVCLRLVPSEYPSGERERRGGITKAGSSSARRGPVEAAWRQRPRPTLGHALRQRSAGRPPAVLHEAGRAQQRLRRRDGHGKRPPVAVVALARELVGFAWLVRTRPALP